MKVYLSLFNALVQYIMIECESADAYECFSPLQYLSGRLPRGYLQCLCLNIQKYCTSERLQSHSHTVFAVNVGENERLRGHNVATLPRLTAPHHSAAAQTAISPRIIAQFMSQCFHMRRTGLDIYAKTSNLIRFKWLYNNWKWFASYLIYFNQRSGDISGWLQKCLELMQWLEMIRCVDGAFEALPRESDRVRFKVISWGCTNVSTSPIVMLHDADHQRLIHWALLPNWLCVATDLQHFRARYVPWKQPVWQEERKIIYFILCVLGSGSPSIKHKPF